MTWPMSTSEEKPSVADSVARFAAAEETPETAFNAFSTRPTQDAQVIPSTAMFSVF